MKKSAFLILCLFALFSSPAQAQDIVGDLFKIETDATDIENTISGTFYLEKGSGKLSIWVYNLQMNRLGSIYDNVKSNEPYSYSFDSSNYSPGIHLVIFIYRSPDGQTEVAHYKVLK